MRTLLMSFFILLLISCGDQKSENSQSNQETPAEENQSTEATSPSEGDLSKGIKVEFDARYDWDENINYMWKDLYGDRPEAVTVLGLPSRFVENDGVFAVVSDIENTKYLTLTADADWNYTLQEVATSANSIVRTFGSSPTSTVALYDLFIPEDTDENIVASFEIFGMTAADDGDGMRPFKKIQHDVITLNDGKLAQDEAATKAFNEFNGVDMEAYPNLSAIEFLSQKYYDAMNEDFDQDKIGALLGDMQIVTKNRERIENAFAPVRKMEDGTYANNIADAEAEAWFINDDNDFELEQVSYRDYPIFYMYDHGSYLYRITNVKPDSDVVLMNAEPLYSMDEAGEINNETGDAIKLMLVDVDGKWVLKYLSSPMMMQKDKEGLKTINTNAGE